MIDPNIWESEDFGDLTFRQRLLHIAMFSGADDEGRGVASIKRLRALAFAYDELSLADVAADLAAVAEVISVDVYEVDGKLFYAYRNWRAWQSVEKPKPSTIPAPEDGEKCDAATIRDMYPTDRVSVGEEPGNDRVSVPDASGLNESKGKEEKGRERARVRATPTPPSQPVEPATKDESETLASLHAVDRYPIDEAKDLQLLRALAADYPTVDLRRAAAAWRIYKLDHPLDAKSSPRSQFRTWVRNDAEDPRFRNTAPNARASPLGVAPGDLPDPDQLRAMIAAADAEEAALRAGSG